MSHSDKTYSIIRRSGGEPQTIETGLSASQARAWLQRQAAESGGTVSPDLVVTDSRGNVWAAVEAE